MNQIGNSQTGNNIYGKRLSGLRAKLRELNADAALITKRENYRYLSGFTGTFANLIITQDSAFLITDFRYVEQAAEQAKLFEIIQYTGKLEDTLNELLISQNVNILGFEESYLSFAEYSKYKLKFSVKELIPLGRAVEELRMVKDETEIDILRKAVQIADNAFTHILGYIKPGLTELEIAAEIEYFMKKQGAEGASFETIVASGVRSSMPHGVASEKKVEQGDVITMDFGAIYKGYCSDMTRTVFMGRPGKEMEKIYNIVLEAQLKSLEGAHKGLKGREIDHIARKIITDAGYGENFGHSLGHGVGLEIHEEPRFSPSSNQVIENGMAVTVEPGIYVAGLGGVRIEDLIIINGRNPIVLTKSPKELIVL
ncbi:MAG TPA: aminopeptidase P family protein [Clostridiaceae bacterium]|nr:aminopeptidase P family protein [Clostridiaceae bacterium]